MAKPKTQVLNLAARAREIFESSEVDEKRQLLNLVFQNLEFDEKNVLTDVREPFDTMIGYRDCPTNWRWRESNSRPCDNRKSHIYVRSIPLYTKRLLHRMRVQYKPLVYMFMILSPSKTHSEVKEEVPKNMNERT